MNSLGRPSFDFRYPGKAEEWEFKLLKVKGFFGSQRFFVKRERGGKDGYLVLAPFYTYHHKMGPYNSAIDEDRYHEYQGAAGGLMVNLGWLPAEHKKDMDFKDTGIEAIDFTDKFEGNSLLDLDTGFEYKKEQDPDSTEPQYKFVEFTGILRRGESWNPLIGNVNMPQHGSMNFVDLDLMYRLNLFANRDSSRAMYLERIVPSLDLESRHYVTQTTLFTLFLLQKTLMPMDVLMP